nr:hypothetical protein CFP56_34532 [Quercus suber]
MEMRGKHSRLGEAWISCKKAGDLLSIVKFVRFCLAMDKSWMNKERNTWEYFEGVKNFVKFASLTARNGRMCAWKTALMTCPERTASLNYFASSLKKETSLSI